MRRSLFKRKNHKTVTQFEHVFTDLSPGHSLLFNDIWDTTGTLEDTYNIVGQVYYDGQTAGTHTVEISRCGGGILPGDVNQNCYVTMTDFSLLQVQWQQHSCGESLSCHGADIDGNGQVELLDLELLVNTWLWCNDPDNVDCDIYWK